MSRQRQHQSQSQSQRGLLSVGAMKAFCFARECSSILARWGEGSVVWGGVEMRASDSTQGFSMNSTISLHESHDTGVEDVISPQGLENNRTVCTSDRSVIGWSDRSTVKSIDLLGVK